MKSKRSNKNAKNSKKNVIFCILGFLLIFLIFMLGFCIFKFINSNISNFKVESRVENIEKSKKNFSKFGSVVSWIKVQGTNIDYPVLYYPNGNFNEIPDDFAWTEADYNGKLNNIVYISGHNIKNLSSNPLIADESNNRFEQLMSFTYLDFVKDNQFIQYTINGKDYVYRIYSVSYVQTYELDLYNQSSYSKDMMKIYIAQTKAKSIFEFDTDVNENDSIISLDTCTRMYGSRKNYHFRVNGRLLRENERIKKVKVKQTSKYDEIEKLMEGGESYEES